MDVYRKVPSDLTEPTLSGAIVSIVAAVIMTILFLSELFAYLAVSTKSEMFIDVNRGGEKIQVNLEMTLHKMPCYIVSLDAQDIMGSHEVNIHGSLYKTRLSRAGQAIASKEAMFTMEDHHGKQDSGHTHEDVDVNIIKEALKNGEGCKLKGFFSVNKVPGNFHISAHAYGHQLNSIFGGNKNYELDLSHTVTHISFGDDDELKDIKNSFDQGVLNPLDGVKKEKVKNDKIAVTYEYYVKVVPTTYEKLNGETYFVHQFTANSNEVTNQLLPAVFFRYDLSPVTVKFTQYRESLLHFLVQICAIIGGVFTVAGIIDSLIHKSVVSVLKKSQLGKMG